MIRTILSRFIGTVGMFSAVLLFLAVLALSNTSPESSTTCSSRDCQQMSRPADIPLPATTERAYFGVGCFWAPDGQFPAQTGVLRTRVGYAGGVKPNPTYKNMCVQ
jgi:hypothetical protein